MKTIEKSIEKSIERMIDEQIESGSSVARIDLDKKTIFRVIKDIEDDSITVKKLGESIQKFTLKMGYGLDYNDVGENNYFVITPDVDVA